MISKIRKRMKGEKGFTLIELLVVIIIIAILDAIAIPTFLGQRSKAQDAAAKSLVRNAMTAIESNFVDTNTYAASNADLAAIEPAIKWPTTMAGAAVASTTTCAPATTSLAKDSIVSWFGDATSYSLATVSASTNLFGVYVLKTGASAGTTFVKKIGTNAVTAGW